jgi:hypothetical protein
VFTMALSRSELQALRDKDMLAGYPRTALSAEART